MGMLEDGSLNHGTGPDGDYYNEKIDGYRDIIPSGSECDRSYNDYMNGTDRVCL